MSGDTTDDGEALPGSDGDSVDPPSATAEPEAEPSAALEPDPARRTALRRTWAQRAVLTVNLLVVVACFAAAGIVWYTSEKANDSKVVTIAAEPPTERPDDTNPEKPDDTVAPLEDLSARNFLITGTDNNACVDPDSPYAGAFQARQFTNNTDTVMMIRIDPTTKRAAILSFPRDLWVRISGSERMGRINSAFNKDDPGPLMATIFENFGIWTDHYVNIDFCAFSSIVDAVGGVKVPFEYATRDLNTGLNVPGPMCYEFDGDSGLAYVRSRYYEYLDPATGSWRMDPQSDFGRISRQQDFMQRLIRKSVESGATSPRAAKKIIDSAIEYVIRDDALTVGKMLQFAQAMRDIRPGSIQTYQIESYPTVVGGAAVLDPRIDGDNMQAVLGVFQGRTQLAEAPEQVFESTTTTQPVVVTTTPVTTTVVWPPPAIDPMTGLPTEFPSDVTTSTTVLPIIPPPIIPPPIMPPMTTSTTTTSTTTTSTTTTTLPESTAVENQKGVVPPDDPDCR